MQLSIPSKLAVCYIGKFIYVSMAYSILTVALEARLVESTAHTEVDHFLMQFAIFQEGS